MTPAQVAEGAPSRRSIGPAGPVRGPLKVGIVSPYGYPHPGGVNEHVRHTYEAMRRMGHDVWIITSRYGKERETEGHVIRLGTGYAFPTNGSMGRVTLSWRFKERARELLAEHRFDVLHFHEPLVPFLSPTVLDQSDTVNIGTFHAFGGFSPSYWIGKRFASQLANKLDGRIAVSGAARHFISRYFPGEYRIIPNGVDLDRFADAEPFEELRDGTINILFVGRFEERKGLIHLLKAYHRLRKRHVDARLLVIGSGPEGARVSPLHRPAPDPRRRVPGPRQRRRQGALLRQRRHLLRAGDRPGELRDRAAGGDGRRRADRGQRHPWLQAGGAARRAGPAGRAQELPRPGGRSLRALQRRRAAAPDGRGGAGARPSTAGTASPSRSWTSTTRSASD